MIVSNPSIVDFIYYDAKVIDGSVESKELSYIDLRPTSQRGKTRIAVTLHYDQFLNEFYKVMLA